MSQQGGPQRIEVRKTILGPRPVRARNVRPRAIGDYPRVPQVYRDVAEVYASPVLMGPPICDELMALVQHLFTEDEAAVVRHLGILSWRTGGRSPGPNAAAKRKSNRCSSAWRSRNAPSPPPARGRRGATSSCRSCRVCSRWCSSASRPRRSHPGTTGWPNCSRPSTKRVIWPTTRALGDPGRPLPARRQSDRGPSHGLALRPAGSAAGPLRHVRRRPVPVPHLGAGGRQGLRRAAAELHRDGSVGRARHRRRLAQAGLAPRTCSRSSARPSRTAWSPG